MPEFDATIAAAERGGAYVAVPADVIDALGGGKHVRVRATFDGVAYTGSIAWMGGGPVLGVLKRIREELGKSVGDALHVTVERDTAERTVAVPDDLRTALDTAGVGAAFDALSFSHRREYVTWIEEAKKPDTRARRITQAVDRLA